MKYIYFLMKKLKILFVDHTPFLGGSQLQLASHLKILDGSKFIKYIVTDKNSPFKNTYNSTYSKIIGIEFGILKRADNNFFKRLILSLVDFKKVIDNIQPDIVLANTTRALIISSIIAFVSHYKLISYIRDYDYPKWLLKLLSIKIKYFLIISKAVRKYYTIDSRKSSVVYPASNLNQSISKISYHEVERLKNQLGIKNKNLVIGFIGRLVFRKGPHILLNAFLNLKHPNCKLVFFGTGQGQEDNIENDLKIKIASLGLEDNIIMAGYIPNQALAYKVINIYVLPSVIEEGFPTTIIEAALSKKPIIATNIGGTREFVKNNINGLLVKPENVKTLSECLSRLIENKSFARRLGDQAFKDAQLFTEEKVTQKLEQIYLQIATSTSDVSK